MVDLYVTCADGVIRKAEQTEILPSNVPANSGPHPQLKNADEIELMSPDVYQLALDQTGNSNIEVLVHKEMILNRHSMLVWRLLQIQGALIEMGNMASQVKWNWPHQESHRVI